MRSKVVSIICISTLLFAAGCAGRRMGGVIEGKKSITEGWLDDNTFQVIAWGEASDNATGEAQWRNQAKEGAQMMAEKRIIEKFKGYSLEAKGYTDSGAAVKMEVTKEVRGIARGGEIVQLVFNEEKRACEITYRVTAKGLKKLAMKGFAKSIKK